MSSTGATLVTALRVVGSPCGSITAVVRTTGRAVGSTIVGATTHATSGGAGASRTTKVIGSVAGASRAARTARTTESTRTIGAKAGARSARVGAEVSLVVLLAVLLDHQHGGDNADNRNHGYNSSNNVKSGVVVVVRAGARAAGPPW